MSRLVISLLGPFQAALAGETITGFESSKVRALLAYLAAETKRTHPRDGLAGLLWPDWPQRSAMNNLRYALADLRKNIRDREAEPPALLITRESIGLNPEGDCWVDMVEFERSAIGSQLSVIRSQQSAIGNLKSAIDLYRGEFLEGFSLNDSPAFEEWILAKREYFKRQALKALHALAEAHQQRGEYEPALSYARRQLELEPWQEEAHQQVMRLLALDGQRSAALAQYETCQRLLAKELGVKPSAETIRLYEAIRDETLSKDSTAQAEATTRVPAISATLKKAGPVSLPLGTVSFLFTDIQGSTPLWEREPEKMAEALQIHNRALRQAIEANGGMVFKLVGDAFQAAFPTAQQALLAAIGAQRGLQAAAWNEPGPLRVRMGLHTGEARLAEGRDDNAVSHTLNRAARIMSAGHGEQILLSSETAELCASYLPHSVRLKDLGQHALKGLARAEHLYQALAPGLQEDFPPLATQGGPEHNLPIQLTGFIGREKEIEQVKELIARHPLVTLTGSGGVGKTRLSLQVAESVLEQFPHGVWYVELAPIADPDLVPQTVAGTLGLREEPGRPLLETLAHFLRNRQALIVLDNCEHLLEACAWLADALLKKAARLKVLVSSREALGIAGESAFRIPSLAAPDPRHMPPLAQFQEYEAVRLFTERARAALPSFQVDERNAPAIAHICRRLDGIPLALELAAARLSLLTTGQLASRLDHAFRLLSGGSRTALPRQQTLRAAIDWSYQLLSEKEQRLLRRLAVFAGGGNLEAIEAVCAGEGLVSEEILDMLAGLANKSMVSVERLQHAETRYRLLETVRQYAGEKLAGEKLVEIEESVTYHDRHLDYYLELAETFEPQMRTPVALDRLQALSREVDNLRASLSWALDREARPRIEAGLRLASALLNFWHTQNFQVEGYSWFEKGLSVLPEDDPALFKIRARACFAAGHLIVPLGRYLEAQQWLSESLEICQKTGDVAGQVMAQCMLGEILSWTDNSQSQAKELWEQSLAICRSLNDPWLLAWVLCRYGIYANNQGDFSLTRQLLEESLSIFEKVGDRLQVGDVFIVIGRSSYFQGDYSIAHNSFIKSLASGQAMQSRWMIGLALSNLGEVAGVQEEYEQMEAYLLESMPHMRDVGNQYLTRSLRLLGHAELNLARPRQAAACYLESLPMAKEANQPYNVYAAMAGVAGAAVPLGYPIQAARLQGAVEALVAVFNVPLGQLDLQEYNRNVAAARAALSEEEFTQAWAEGRALAPEAAIQETLALGAEIGALREQ